MALFPRPHSPEWFEALEAFNPQQAAHTRRIIELAGRDDVCGICGDDPAADYRLLEDMPPNAVGTMRLCDDCVRGRGAMYGETFEPLT